MATIYHLNGEDDIDYKNFHNILPATDCNNQSFNLIGILLEEITTCLINHERNIHHSRHKASKKNNGRDGGILAYSNSPPTPTSALKTTQWKIICTQWFILKSFNKPFGILTSKERSFLCPPLHGCCGNHLLWQAWRVNPVVFSAEISEIWRFSSMLFITTFVSISIESKKCFEQI